jgi:serine/threonine-protein kinase
VTELAGRYAVEGTLGQGAFGTVYRARDRELDRVVAVKVLRADVTNPEVRARFEREAKLAASVEHPNVVRLLDHGRLDGGAPFLVFEFVEGASLEDWLDDGVEPGQWASWTRDVAAGLAALHEVGAIHRDVKPANVLVHQDGRAMLADLGLARAEEATCDGLTATGALVGTPLYMAPELFRPGGTASPEADLFALGCLAYRGLYGADWRQPGSYGQLLAHGPGEAGEPPAARLGRFPEADVWLRGLLHPDPAARLGPAAKVVQVIEDSLVEVTRTVTRAVPPPDAPPTRTTTGPTPPPQRGRAAAVLAFVALGLGVTIGFTSRSAGPGAGSGRSVAEDEAVVRAKEELWRLAGSLPKLEPGLARKEAKRVYRTTQLDFRTPLKFKRCLQAMQGLQALGYLPREDESWYPGVVVPICRFLETVGDMGLSRIDGAFLDPKSLDEDQSFRIKINAILAEIDGVGLEFVDAAARAGRLGRHWREDLLFTKLCRHADTEYGEVLVPSLLAGLEAETEPVWRAFLLDELGKVTRFYRRLGLDLAGGEEVASAIVAWSRTRLGESLAPVPLTAPELADVVRAEIFLWTRRAMRGELDGDAEVRCTRVADLALRRTGSEEERHKVASSMLRDLEVRIGVFQEVELESQFRMTPERELEGVRMEGLRRLRDRLREAVAP